MRILMLGWEFPPFIAGGLGTACHGLTRALNKAGHEILFVLPKPIGAVTAEHVSLIGPDRLAPVLLGPREATQTVFQGGAKAVERLAAAGVLPNVAPPEAALRATQVAAAAGAARTRMYEIEAPLASPYNQGGAAAGSAAAQQLSEMIRLHGGVSVSGGGGEGGPGGSVRAETAEDLMVALQSVQVMAANGHQYGHDLMGDADRYAKMVGALSRRLDFDVVHAHDWLAFPGGAAVKAATGKPLVCHVHATEFDRSGEHINQMVYDVERMGMHAADRIVAVSKLTRDIIVARYGVDPDKIDVVYNGVVEADQPPPGMRIASDDKIVLFLGRITMQKGPEYFIRAAKRVLEKIENVKFVVAGSGDMATRMIEEAAHLGIGHKVLFTGFLRGSDVDRVFRMADCYVMPSVSEPFGIAALEAIQRETPCIISKQSGVSEVLSHALKVDFWDVDDMATKIVAVLRHPPLSQTLREHGAFEVRRLTWDDSAERCVESYRAALAGRRAVKV